MSIHHNINIPAVDIERLWGAASIKMKQTDDKTARAFWAGVMATFALIGQADPPGQNAFIAELENSLEVFTDGELI